jgi:hypothetical protein
MHCNAHLQIGEATDIPVLKLFEFLVASICLFMIEVGVGGDMGKRGAGEVQGPCCLSL